MLSKLNFQLEGSVKGEALDPNARSNRGRGKHRSILQFKKIAENKFVLITQDRIELVT